jgi:hypothetical protein
MPNEPDKEDERTGLRVAFGVEVAVNARESPLVADAQHASARRSPLTACAPK